MRKPRPHGPLSRLSDEQRAKLHEMLFIEPRPYREIAAILKSSFGVSTSLAALGEYYHRQARENLMQSIAAQAGEATLQAPGVEITITFQQPGEIKLEVRPLAERGKSEAKPGGSER